MFFTLCVDYTTTLTPSEPTHPSVCVNKGLIRIKSIFKTLKISYYTGKDKVSLCGGTWFESCPMHVSKYCNILFIYLCVLKIGYIILCFSRSVRITLRHRCLAPWSPSTLP